MKVSRITRTPMAVLIILTMMLAFGMGAVASESYGTTSQSNLPDLVSLNSVGNIPSLAGTGSVEYLAPTYITADTPSSGIAKWETKSINEYTTIECDYSSTQTWNAGWYVVGCDYNEDGFINGEDAEVNGATTTYNINSSSGNGITVNGAVNLILVDGFTLNVKTTDADSAGICVSGSGNSLTIYGQSEGTGKLTAQCVSESGDANGAGIGGGVNKTGSNITINGGTVEAICESDANGPSYGSKAAGIGGGGDTSGVDNSGSDITINGGTVTAKCISASANAQGAGIGGGFSGSCSDISINGGVVNACSTSDKCSASGAGIGGGNSGFGTGITINDGTVYASCISTSGRAYGAGIGGGMYGQGSVVSINGGTVSAQCKGSIESLACAIGNGNSCSATASNITIATDIDVQGGSDSESTSSITNTGGDLATTLATYKYVKAVKPVVSYKAPVYNTANDAKSGLKEFTNQTTQSYTLINSDNLLTTWGTTNAESWYVVKGNVTIAGTVTCLGDVHLILTDGCTLVVSSTDGNSAGICVSGEGNSLTIYGQSGGTGILTAACSPGSGDAYGAGIGGGCDGSGSNITINGGTVTANCTATNSDACGAGIGGGYDGSGSNITINGGTVTAKCTATGDSKSANGAGIGGGFNRSGSNITINGGIVTADCNSNSGNANGAGIGGGDSGGGSNIIINGGTVTAGCNSDSNYANGAGIGGGNNAGGVGIIINGGIVNASCKSTLDDAYGAGLGGGNGGAGSDITINSGTVNAVCESGSGCDARGAGIGGGNGSAGSDITINGGTVTAQCKGDYTRGVAIGAGYNCSTTASGIKVATNLTVLGGTSADSANKNVAHTATKDIAGDIKDFKYLTVSSPLKFTAEEADSTLTFSWSEGSNVEVMASSTAVKLGDVAATGVWESYTEGTTITLTNEGDSVMFRGTNVKTNSEGNKYFTMSGKIAASGDVTSLTNGIGGDVKPVDYCCAYMFRNCTALTSAPNLPSTTLSNGCYLYMFNGCKSLTTPPELPATTLKDGCYAFMFSNCSSLESAPELPAETLTSECYTDMFYSCGNLESAPDLPATTLAKKCYQEMFDGCSSLEIAPELPAENLADNCYQYMFKNCIKLKAPAMMDHVKTLATRCCNEMYYGCSDLRVYTTSRSGYSTEWKVPDIATADNWNTNMFLYAASGITGDDILNGDRYPSLNTTYYIKSPSADPTASDFTFTAPSDTSYTGSGITATVETADGITGMGEVTVYYSTDGESWSDKAPVSVGTGYKVGIKVEAGDNYNATGEDEYITSEDWTFNITQAPLTVTFSSADKTYDGKSTKEFTIANSSVSGVIEGEDVTVKATVTYGGSDANTYNNAGVKFSLSGDNAGNYKTPEDTTLSSVKIEKRSVTVTSGSAEKEYDGTPLTKDDVKVTSGSFVEGEGFTLLATGSQTLVGSSDNTIICTPNNGTNEDNYDITKSMGTLEVTARTTALTITVYDQEKLYDGTSTIDISFDVYSISGNLAGGDTITVTPINTNYKTHAGTYTDGIGATYVIKNDSDVDVTDAYANVTVDNGDLTIKKRSVTLTSASDTKDYDGTPLSNDRVVVSGADGFIDGEGATYNNFASRTSAGTSSNTFDYTLKENTTAGDYDIETKYGTLTVNKIAYTGEKTATGTVGSRAGSTAEVTLPAVPEGGSYGTPVSKNTKVSAAVSDNKVTLNVGTALVESVEADQEFTVTVPVTSTNYKDYNIIITITTVFKSEPTADDFTFAAPENLTYSGTAKEASVTGEGIGTVTVYYSGDNGETWSKDAPKTVGTYKVKVDVAEGDDYLAGTDITAEGWEFTIARADLAIDSDNPSVAKDRPYNAGTSVKIKVGTVTGIAEGDEGAVTVTATGEIADKNVGEDKEVTVVYSVSGDKAGNYNAPEGETLTATIYQVPLTIYDYEVASKTYDGTAAGIITEAGTLEEGYTGDDVELASATATFASADAGEDIAVTIVYTLKGDDAGNYYAVDSMGFADITPKVLTVKYTKVSGKTYDGTTDAAVTAYGLSGIIKADKNKVELDKATGTFESAAAGDNIKVTVEYILKGDKAANYTVADYETTADIRPAELSVSGTVAKDKTYDGTIKATVTPGTLKGIVDGDDVAIDSYEASFSDVNVGTDKEVSVIYQLKGEDSANYIVGDDTSSADINAKKLTVEGTTVADNEYDGETTATITNIGTLKGVVDGDDVAIATATATFETATAGQDITVTVVYTLKGRSSGNYTVANSTIKGNITMITNIISDFSCDDITTLGTPAPEGTAVTGELIYTYSATEDGTYGTWEDTYNGAGTYYVKATSEGNENYVSDTEVRSFKVVKADNVITLSKYGDATIIYGNLGYLLPVATATSGEEVTRTITKDGTVVTNYTESVGKYIVTWTAGETDIYKAAEPVSITITVEPRDLSQIAELNAIADQIYTGKAITPAISITRFSSMEEGTDYTVVYSNNIKVGTATVAVSFNGNYTGTITGTFNIVNGKSIATPGETGVDKWLNTEDHIAYINGDDDGNFRPEGEITRSETAAIFYRLLNNQNVTITKSFSDVDADKWYAQSVGVLASLGILAGYEDGTFRPEGKITRAEFVTIAMRFAELTEGENPYSDVTGHWGEKYIISASAYGWIKGYEDGTFHPDGKITRAEAVAIVNRVLYRFGDKEYIDANAADLKAFGDISAKEWYYHDVMEAANPHNYDFDTEGSENWK